MSSPSIGLAIIAAILALLFNALLALSPAGIQYSRQLEEVPLIMRHKPHGNKILWELTEDCLHGIACSTAELKEDAIHEIYVMPTELRASLELSSMVDLLSIEIVVHHESIFVDYSTMYE